MNPRLLLLACVLSILSACEKRTPPPVPASSPPATPATTPAPASPEEKTPADMGKEEMDPLQGRKELPALPDEFYGKWKLTGSGGGFSGERNPPPQDESIEILKTNKLETWKQGKLVSSVPFRIARGKSIFGNDNWLISPANRELSVIYTQGADKLNISENHPDGYSWTYERVR